MTSLKHKAPARLIQCIYQLLHYKLWSSNTSLWAHVTSLFKIRPKRSPYRRFSIIILLYCSFFCSNSGIQILINDCPYICTSKIRFASFPSGLQRSLFSTLWFLYYFGTIFRRLAKKVSLPPKRASECRIFRPSASDPIWTQNCCSDAEKRSGTRTLDNFLVYVSLPLQ